MALPVVDQAFLQSMMASKALSVNDAINLYNKCLDANSGERARKLTDPRGLELRIDAINEKLCSLELQFRTLYSPWEEETFWGLCNTIEDDAIRVANIFSKHQTELLFDILEELQESDGLMTLIDAQNRGLEFQLTTQASSNAIQRMNELKWLKIIRRHGSHAKVTFGARSLLELPKVRAWVIKTNAERLNGNTNNHEEIEMQDSVHNEEEIMPNKMDPDDLEDEDLHRRRSRTVRQSRTREDSEDEAPRKRSRR